MKVLGLLLWLIGFASVLYFKNSMKLTPAEFTAALCFVFFCGALLAFYDRIKSLKVFGGGVEFAENRINKAADKALVLISMAVKKHADRISALTDEARKQAERIELLASGEPELIVCPDDGYARTLMVYTDKYGKKYAEYKDKEGKCKRLEWELERSHDEKRMKKG